MLPREKVGDSSHQRSTSGVKRKQSADSFAHTPLDTPPSKRQLRDCTPLIDDNDSWLAAISSSSPAPTPSSATPNAASPGTDDREECSIWQSVSRTLGKAEAVRILLRDIALSQARMNVELDRAEQELQQTSASYDRMLEGLEQIGVDFRRMTSELPALPRDLCRLPEGGPAPRSRLPVRRRRKDYRSMWDQTTPSQGPRYRTDYRGMFDQ